MKKFNTLQENQYHIKEFYLKNKENLNLTLVTEESTLQGKIIKKDVNRPGLIFSGFKEGFAYEKIQLIGTAEWNYLSNLSPEKRKENFEKNLKQNPSPAWFISRGFEVIPELKFFLNEQNIPLFLTTLKTIDFLYKAHRELEYWFSPYAHVHGSLVDVYGVGMFYIGESGIGKSECVLDLIERGHRLVSDDQVTIIRNENSIIGRCNSKIGHYMEIRGIGIIQVEQLFGVRAVRETKKIEVVVELEYWQDNKRYNRTGLDEEETDIMGIKIPKKTIPLSPGKNITVISEVIAMDTLLKQKGVNMSKEFNQKIKEQISQRKNTICHDIGGENIFE